MSSVDDRIVNMKFNNSQFGQGVDKTKRDLTGLEKTIVSAGKSKGMASLGAATEGVRVKFSALQVAGAAALATIVSKATSAGLSLLKSFTIQPIIDGFKEYQTGLQSVQTIMSNTGKSVKVVEAGLDKLNQYADQTIYNFAEMAKNVGTFTAAGVDLNTSIDSIKGIANLAALSGSNSQQASTAMYQLSQAISAGKVGLQDWNSVVNAGMGGKIFQTALTRTAMNMGTLNDGAVKFEGALKKLTVNGESFRSSISAAAGTESYLTGDVLVETLKQISGGYTVAELRSQGFTKKAAEDIDKLAKTAFDAATQIKTLPQLVGVIRESIGSTFANAFRIVLGGFEQSKKLWGDVGYAIIGPHGFITRMQDAFTGTLEGWADNRGREKVLKGFKRLFYGLTSVVGAFTGAFTDIFPPATSSTLVSLSGAFKRFALNLRPSKDTLEDLRNIFKGIFSVIHIGYSIVAGAVKLFGNFFGALFSGSEGARGGIFSLLGSFGQVLTAIDKFLTSGGKLQDVMGGIGTVLGSALQPVLAVIGLVISGFASLVSGKGLGGVLESFTEAKNIFGGFVGGIISGLDQLTAPFDALKSDIADVAIKIASPFQGLIDKLEAVRLKVVEGLGLDSILPSLDGMRTLLERVKFHLSGFAEGLRLPSVSMTDLGNATDWVVEKFNAMIDTIGKAASKLDISDKLKGAKDAFADFFDGLGGGASSAGGGAASAGISAMGDTADGASTAFSKLGGVMSGIWDIFGAIAGGIGAAFKGMVDAISNIPFPDDALEWASVLNVVIAGGLIKKLLFSKGPMERLGDAIKGIGKSAQQTFGELTNTLKTMQGAIKAEMIRNIAIAVAILVASLVALSFIPAEKLAKGLGALAIVMKLADMSVKSMLDGVDKIKVKELAQKASALLAVGAAMVLMATAVAILTAAVVVLSFLNWTQLAKGLGSVAILIGIMVVALERLSGNSAKIAAAGAAMVLMATAVDILVGAIVVLGLIPFDVLKQGLAGVAIGIGIMVVALEQLKSDPKGIAAAGLAMVLMATAMNIMVASITALGLLPWDVVARGLAFTAIGMALMVAALAVLSAKAEGALAGAAAMVLLAGALMAMTTVILALGSAPWEVVARGLLFMAAGLLILVAAGYLAMNVVPGLLALAVVIGAIGQALFLTGAGFLLFATGLALIVGLGVAGIAVFTLAIGAFIALLPQIAVQMAAAFVTFVQSIALAAPKLRKAFGTIFKEMIGTVRDAIPQIGKLIQTLIDTAISILSNSVPQWIELGFHLIDSFIQSMADHVPNIIDNAVSLVKYFLEEMGAHAAELGNAGLDLVVDVINGISDAIENSGKVRDAAYNLVRTFADEIREAMGEILGAINPMDYLPSVDFGSLKDKLLSRGYGGANTRDAPLDSSIAATSSVLSKAIIAAVPELVVFIQGIPVDIGRQAYATRALAGNQAAEAESMAESAGLTSDAADADRSAADDAKAKAADAKQKAKAAKKEAEKKKATAKEKKASEKAKKKSKDANTKARNAEAKAVKAEADAAAQKLAADAKAEQAAATQRQADFLAKKVQDETAYRDADSSGKGDIMSSRADSLVEEANALQAQAQAKANEAARLEQLAAKGGKNAAKYRQQAAQLRKEATAETAESMMLASEAINAQAAAVAAYAAARKEAAESAIKSLAEIKQEQIEKATERAWQQKYEDKDTTDAERIKMLNDRIAANTTKSVAAQDALNAAYAQSDALAQQIASDPSSVTDEQLAAVQKALADAEKAASDANTAMDAIESDKNTIENLQKAIDDATQAKTSANSSITPSRSALEDAALAVDRYTTSVQQAEDAALSEQSVTQFVQNNYSPEALSASEIYRQTKNLTSVADVKMGV